jgi:hypothetical protein
MSRNFYAILYTVYTQKYTVYPTVTTLPTVSVPCPPPEGAVRLQPGMGLPGHSKGFVKAGRRDQVHQAAQGEFQVIPWENLHQKWVKKKKHPLVGMG